MAPVNATSLSAVQVLLNPPTGTYSKVSKTQAKYIKFWLSSTLKKKKFFCEISFSNGYLNLVPTACFMFMKHALVAINRYDQLSSQLLIFVS